MADFNPADYGVPAGSPPPAALPSTPPPAVGAPGASPQPAPFDPSAFGIPAGSQTVSRGPTFDPKNADDIKAAAENRHFDPAAHVAGSGNDPAALDFAAQVEDYRNKNLGAFQSPTNFVNSIGNNIGSAVDAAKSGFGVPSLARGALSTLSNAGGVVGNDLLAKIYDDTGRPELADPKSAQAVADMAALVGGARIGSQSALQDLKNLHHWDADVFQNPSVDELRGRIADQASTLTLQDQEAHGNPFGGTQTAGQIQAAGGQLTPPSHVEAMSTVLNPENLALAALGEPVARGFANLPENIASGVGHVAGAAASAAGVDLPTAGVIAENAAIRAKRVADGVAAIPQQVAGGAIQAAGLAGQAAQKVVGAKAFPYVVGPVAGIAGALGLAGPTHGLSLAQIPGEILESAFFGSKLAPKLQKLAKNPIFQNLSDAGADVRANGFPSIPVPSGVAGRVLYDAGAAAARGAGGGAAMGGVLGAANPQPGSVGSGMASGATLGAGGALLKHTLRAMDAYWGAANDPRLKGVLSSVSAPYGTNPTLDAVHDHAMSQLSGADQAKVNRARNLMAGGAEIYVLPSEQFQQVAGQNSAGVYYGDDGKIFLNQDTVALGHELGHAVQDDMKANDPATFNSLKENIDPKALDEHTDNYNDLIQGDNPDAKPIPKGSDQAVDEYLADQIQLALEGKPLHQLGVKDRFGTVLTSALGRLVERVTGSSLTEKTATLGAKPSFVSDKLIRDYLDKMANRPGAAPKPKEENGPQTPPPEQPETGPAAKPAPVQSPEDVAVAVAKRITDADRSAGRAAANPETGFPDSMTFQAALGSLANILSDSGKNRKSKLNSPESQLAYLDKYLGDTASWKQLTPDEKMALVDFVGDNVKSGYAEDLFHVSAHELAVPGVAPEVEGQSPAKAAEPDEAPEPKQPVEKMPLSPNGVSEFVVSRSVQVVPSRAGTPNVRVGPEKASPTPFHRTSEEEYSPGESAPGLRVGTRRDVAPDGSIYEKSEPYLVGTSVDRTNPQEAELLRQAAEHAPDPENFTKGLESFEEAIRSGKPISYNYRSAERDGEGVPTAKESRIAQEQAKFGVTGRNEVEKTMTPTAIKVYPKKKETIFTAQSIKNAVTEAKKYYQKAENNRSLKPQFLDADGKPDLSAATKAIRDIAKKRRNGEPLSEYHVKQAEEVDDFLDKEERPVFYATGYSQDKVIANAHNLERALRDSRMDDAFRQETTYLGSKDLPADLEDRALNHSHGYRADGKPFVDADGNSSPDKAYTPKKLPDWKVQVLNALEGGPAKNAYQDFNANAQSAGREPIEDPHAQGGNPFFSRLKEQGEGLFINRPGGPVKGLSNIIDNATETVRLDRLGRVHGQSDITTPPSSHKQRAAAFMPESKPPPKAAKRPSAALAGVGPTDEPE